MANLIGGAVFPIGLIAIFMTGANLYTGNCMYLLQGEYIRHKIHNLPHDFGPVL